MGIILFPIYIPFIILLIHQFIIYTFYNKTEKLIDSFLKTCVHYKCNEGICYGLRKKDTYIGSWIGAYVCCIRMDGCIIDVIFENNKEHILSSSEWSEHKNSYDIALMNGWEAMTREDIKKTANI